MFERDRPLPNPVRRSRSLKRRMTWTEARLWKELRKLDVNFRRQAPIGRYFADFASHARRLVIEIDGGVHARLPDVAARDLERQAWLESQGYRVLRFTDRQVSNDLHGCLETVRKLLGLQGPFLPDGWNGVRAPAPLGFRRRLSAITTTPAPPPSRRRGAPIRRGD
ncbi:MAG TPA: endonuclease domain-containing protein [Phenylobacterium sp.]|uniref:endonuclease domain-containing protein n=1 Tax=Phenylobacterium sp. TaxID=1871053 RepID=UPI002C963388|nr:endonuclease domain-containing protein [Phenylobacterium sp.]HSV03565.1 endonuclease domain-containing protein [Phenylobacterium sp.]